MRRLVSSLALIFATAAPASSGAAVPLPSDWTGALRASRVAYARGDLDSARALAGEVDSIVGGHLGSMSMLARIAARQGRTSDALRWLGDLAGTGLSARLAADTTFAALASDPRFRELIARFDSNAAPIARARVAHRLDDPELLTEDVAWDPEARRFLVSSIHRRKIVAIDASGRVTEFAHAPSEAEWGIYALALDAERERLWATVAAGPEAEGFAAADSGRSALLAFDRVSGRVLQQVEIARDGARHVLGDLSLGPDGAVYVTDSVGGGVYRLRPGAAAFDTLAPPGAFSSPQQSTLTRDGRRLLLADYTRGIAAIDLATLEARWLGKPRLLASVGIDGLVRDGDRLIAIQNGTGPHRVLALTLDPAETRIVAWQVLERASPDLGEPNHGVIVGRDLYLIGNSGWERVNDRGVLDAPAGATPPVLLRLNLAEPR